MSDTPARPRLASTLLLLRDQPQMQVLMVKRHYEIDFAAGAFVFPGGKSNDEDASEAWLQHVDGACDEGQRIARITAIRETYEESGILLARPRTQRGEGGCMVGRDVAGKLAPLRAAVDARELSFLELIAENALVLALDRLVHFGHWITPVMMPKRFDTHFYLALAPDTQIALHDGRETTDTAWLEPAEALRMEEEGRATIIFPTRLNLRKLGQVRLSAEAMRRFATEPVITVEPQLGRTDDGQACLHIPDVPGYEQTVELLSHIDGVARRAT